MEAQEGRCGKMTFKAMGCAPQETERRKAVCARLNVLAHKRDTAQDETKRKRIDRSIAIILRQERPWLKDIAFYLY